MRPQNFFGVSTHRLLSSIFSFALCSAASVAYAAPKCDGRIALPKTITLEPATAQELVAGSPELAVQLNDLSNIPAFQTLIRRTLPVVWQSQLAADGSDGVVTAEYELTGENGCQNCLSHSQTSQSRVQTTLEALPITITDKPENDKNCRTISGGFNLILDLKSAAYAGTYKGQLLVTITRL